MLFYDSQIVLKYGPVRGTDSLGNTDIIIIIFFIDNLFLGSNWTINSVTTRGCRDTVISQHYFNDGYSPGDISRYMIIPNLLRTA